MTSDGPVRWGILGTAGIAHRSLLPAVRHEDNAVAWAVASRDGERGRAFQAAEGISRMYASYEALLDDPEVEVVYIPLPNHLHRPWTERALRAGKAVLCEKPLGLNADETAQMIAVAQETGQPLWEAFVFPFQAQYLALQDELPAIGRIARLEGSFAFHLQDPGNVRWNPAWGGGSLYDVGCYPAHLARLVLASEPVLVRGFLRRGPQGVDVEAEAVVRFDNGAVLHLTAGFEGPYDTSFRIVGQEGEVRIASPYHQRAAEVLEVTRGERTEWIRLGSTVPSFAPAVRHIGAVVRGQEAPRHLAADDALGTARLLDMLLALESV